MSAQDAAEFSGKTIEQIKAIERVAAHDEWQRIFNAEYEALRNIHAPADAALIAEYYANQKTGRAT